MRGRLLCAKAHNCQWGKGTPTNGKRTRRTPRTSCIGDEGHCNKKERGKPRPPTAPHQEAAPHKRNARPAQPASGTQHRCPLRAPRDIVPSPGGGIPRERIARSPSIARQFENKWKTAPPTKTHNFDPGAIREFIVLALTLKLA